MAWPLKRKLIKPIKPLAATLEYEITGPANAAARNTRKARRVSIVPTSKAEGKKGRDSTLSTLTPYASVATSTWAQTLASTTSGKSAAKGKNSWTNLYSLPILTIRKTERQNIFTGVRNYVSKPRISLLDIAVVLVLVIAFIYLKDHLILGWK